MTASALDAARAYLQAANTARNAAPTDAGGVSTDIFGSLVQQSLANTEVAGKAAEAQAASLAVGRADLIDVVTAVAAAEASLQTVVAIRDQIVRAYQEIARMPI